MPLPHCSFPVLIVQLNPKCIVLLGDTRSQLTVVFFVAPDTCWGHLFMCVLFCLLSVSFLECKMHARGTWFAVVHAVSSSVSRTHKLLRLLLGDCASEEGQRREGPWAPISHHPQLAIHRVDVAGGGKGVLLGKPGHTELFYSSLCHLRKGISSLQASISLFLKPKLWGLNGYTFHENPVEITKWPIHTFNIDYYHVPTGALKIQRLKKICSLSLRNPCLPRKTDPQEVIKGCLTWLLPRGLPAGVPDLQLFLMTQCLSALCLY